MKVKLPKPFYTARVAEALSTLTNYVSDGYRITNEIKPVQATGGSLVDDPDSVPKGPILLELVPDADGITQPISLATFNPGDIETWLESANLKLSSMDLNEIDHILTQIGSLESPQNGVTIMVVVNGENLKNVQRLVLIRANNLSDATLTAAHVFASQSLVYATINIPTNDLPAGATYHVWVQDNFGQEDLLIDALKDYEGHKTHRVPALFLKKDQTTKGKSVKSKT